MHSPTADAVAFEEQSHALHANEVVWVEATNGSYCLAPRHLSPKQPFTVEMCLPLNSSDDGVPWRRVRCIVQLVHRDMDDAYWPRTVEVIQVCCCGGLYAHEHLHMFVLSCADVRSAVDITIIGQTHWQTTHTTTTGTL